MEKLYPSNKVRFRHLYDKTDKEEQILLQMFIDGGNVY